MFRRARTALVITATSMKAKSSSRSGPSKPSTSPEKFHMPCAETPVAMEAATIVRMSSAGRGATYVAQSRATPRMTARSKKYAAANPTRANTEMMTAPTGLSETKVVT
ncbi:hypothetical protein GCM10023259_048470 [Thermocatellispora tengchongensis]